MSYRRADHKAYEEACKHLYKRSGYVYTQHHARFVANVTNRHPKLVCQDCKGRGGYKEIILYDEGTGPWFDCGWCEGTGYVTPHIRGTWLRMMKAEKKAGHTYR